MKRVLVNGCFDMLHPGHIYMLQKARTYGDHLTVAINSSASILQLKGRLPFYNDHERATMLEALACVNQVVGFSEGTAVEVCTKLKPDVYVTGEMYWGKSLEYFAVRKYGGSVVAIGRWGDYSTTNIRKRLETK